MSITYAVTGLTQQDDTVTGNSLSAASTSNVTAGTTLLSFTGLSFTNALGSITVIGKVITAPAVLAGALVQGATGPNNAVTTITVNRSLATALPIGQQITFADSDHILITSQGCTVTDVGTFPLGRSRLISLTGTSGQFNINGTFFNDAKWNTYAISSTGAQSSQSGFRVAGTFNSLNTSNNTILGTANGTGSITMRPTNQAAQQDSYGGPMFVIGTLNMIGSGYYGNNYWTLDGNGTTGCTVNLTNSILRTGVSTGNLLVSVYSDAYNGAGTTNGRHTFNINNSNIIDTYLKFLAVKPSSQFNNVRWYKTIPQSNTLATNLDIAIAVAPRITTDTYGFNFNGPTFGLAGVPASYYNTHIALGNTSSNSNAPTAVRSTVYGYEVGVAPRIGKVVDFPSVRPWVEGRKNLALTIRNPNGTAVAANAVGTYLEDSNLNTGGLASVGIMSAGGTNSGYTNGTWTSAANAITGGGTGGQVTITVEGGRVTNAVITAVGSGYTAASGTGISVQVNNTTYPGAGTPGTTTATVIFPFNRYASFASSGNFTANQTYTANTTAAGLLASTANPILGNGTAAYAGVDFMLWAANACYNDLVSAWGNSQALVPIDQRFSANGATNYSINVPLRGYGYEDSSYILDEAGGGGTLPAVTDSILLSTDDYVNATGITPVTAATYTDVTLVTPAPTRGTLRSGDVTGALIPSTIGTLQSTANRTLDQIYAKAKYDYTRPVLNTAAGTVAHTGFGISPFLTATGATSNATMNIGNFTLSAATGALSQGSVFKNITTTSNAIIAAQPTNGTWAGISANSIQLISGNAATWNTSFTPTLPLIGGNTPIQIGGLGALAAPGPAQYTPTGQTLNTPTPYNSNRDRLQQALSAVLPNGSIVTAGATTGTQTWSGTISFNTNTWNGADSTTIIETNTTFLGGSALQTTSTSQFFAAGPTGPFNTGQGFNIAQGLITRSIRRMVFGQAVGDADATITFTSGLPATNFAPSTSYTLGWTMTAASAAITGNAFDAITGQTSSGTNAGWISGVATTSVLISGVTYPMSFSLPSVVTAVTPAPTFTTTRATAIINATTTNIVPSGAGTAPLGIVQNLAATTAITGLNTTGSVVTGPSTTAPVLVNFGSSSAITMTGDLVFTNATLTGTLTLTPGAANRIMRFVGCDTTNLILVNTTPATVIGLNNYQRQPAPTGFQNFSVIQVTADVIGGTWTLYNGTTVLQTGTVTTTSFQITATGYSGLVWGQIGNVPIQKQYTNSLINNTFDIVHTAIIGGIPLASTQLFTSSLNASNQLILTTTTGVATSALATAGVFTRDSICNLVQTPNFQAMINTAARAGGVVSDIITVTGSNAITFATTYIQFRSSPTSVQLYVGGITAVTANGFPDLTANLTVSGASVAGVYQILNWPNSTVDTGAIVPAVQQATAGQFAKLDAGVKLASLVIPYAGSTYP